jgi:hypothetical protein
VWILEANNHGYTRMATQRREESERRSKRQGSGIRKEGGDEFKASPTRGRIKEEIFLREDVGNEIQIDIVKDSKRSKQQD